MGVGAELAGRLWARPASARGRPAAAALRRLLAVRLVLARGARLLPAGRGAPVVRGRRHRQRPSRRVAGAVRRRRPRQRQDARGAADARVLPAAVRRAGDRQRPAGGSASLATRRPTSGAPSCTARRSRRDRAGGSAAGGVGDPGGRPRPVGGEDQAPQRAAGPAGGLRCPPPDHRAGRRLHHAGPRPQRGGRRADPLQVLPQPRPRRAGRPRGPDRRGGHSARGAGRDPARPRGPSGRPTPSPRSRRPPTWPGP